MPDCKFHGSWGVYHWDEHDFEAEIKCKYCNVTLRKEKTDAVATMKFQTKHLLGASYVPSDVKEFLFATASVKPNDFSLTDFLRLKEIYSRMKRYEQQAKRKEGRT